MNIKHKTFDDNLYIRHYFSRHIQWSKALLCDNPKKVLKMKNKKINKFAETIFPFFFIFWGIRLDDT